MDAGPIPQVAQKRHDLSALDRAVEELEVKRRDRDTVARTYSISGTRS
jgi:hypothetical protein